MSFVEKVYVANDAGTTINPATSDAQTDGSQVTKITDGTTEVAVTTGGLLEVNAHPHGDFISDVSMGIVTGYSTIDKFGQNSDIDIGTEDLWTGGGTWVAPTAARTHQIVSTSTDDDGDPVGTGARTISITGIKADGTRGSETITMNGTTNVATANTYTMIDMMEVITVGSTGSNVGTITATADTDSTVTARIEATYNQTRQAIFQVPTAAQATISSWYFTVSAGTPVTTLITLQIQEKKNVADSPWVTRHIEIYDSDVVSEVHHQSEHYKKFSAGSYIRMRVTTNKDNTSVTGGFNLLISDN